MLPQWWIKRSAIGTHQRRDYGWRLGMVIQLLGLFGFCFSVFFTSGSSVAAGLLMSLAVLSVGRAFTSVFSKDIQAEYVAKRVRGRFTGLVSTVSGGLSIGFALLLITGLFMENRSMVAWSFVFLCGVVACTLLLSFPLTCKREVEQQQPTSLLAQFQENPLLTHMVLSRCLLLHAMLAIPFIGSSLGAEQGINIGWLILVSGIASLTASYIWGVFSDREVIKTLALSASLCLVVLWILAVFLQSLSQSMLLGGFYLLLVGYDGVRIGRKTLLLNATTDDNRLAFVGVGNTFVGVFLLVSGGVLSVLYTYLGTQIMWFMLLCLMFGIVHLFKLNKVLQGAVSA